MPVPLTEEEEKLFKSDFKHVVHYLRQVRMGQKFDVLPDEVQHVMELLDLLFSLTKDPNFKDAIRRAQSMAKRKGEPVSMRSLFGEAKAEGIAIGMARTEERIQQSIQQERRSIMDRLIAGGMAPQEAARYTGLAF